MTNRVISILAVAANDRSRELSSASVSDWPMLAMDTRYIHFDLYHLPESRPAATNYTCCSYRGAMMMCGPRGLIGEPDHLFHDKRRWNPRRCKREVRWFPKHPSEDAFEGVSALFTSQLPDCHIGDCAGGCRSAHDNGVVALRGILHDRLGWSDCLSLATASGDSPHHVRASSDFDRSRQE